MPQHFYILTDRQWVIDYTYFWEQLKAIYPRFVDIEKPTEDSSGFEIFIKGTTKVTDTIHLPIHFRYHAPSEEQ